jgi:precorrin-2/cobalt-factor-2 C20-methyltransferase
MIGNLYAIGVGPGDPELLTLKAVRIIKNVGVICAPKSRETAKSLALSTVSSIADLKDKETVEMLFPMKKTKSHAYADKLEIQWQKNANFIIDRLNRGLDVAFITIGDPSLYSTFFYLYDKILTAIPTLKIEIVPGVSSVNAAASRAGIPLGLGDERIVILPATYASDIGEMLSKADTVVLMKVHRAFDRIMSILSDMKLVENAIYIAKAGMDDELIIQNLWDVKEEHLNYLSMVIVRRNL